MRDFFVSYRRADSRLASWVADQLKAEGFTCYLQAKDSARGRTALEFITWAFRDSHVLVAVITRNYFGSEFTETEFNFADSRKTLLVRFAPVEIPLYREGKPPVDILKTYSNRVDLFALPQRERSRALIAAARRARLGR